MARQRRAFGLAVAALLTVAILASLAAVFFLVQSLKATAGSTSPTITRIERLGDLVVLRVNITDVLEDAGYEYEGLWRIKGDALVKVDMQAAKVRSTDRKNRRLVVELPQPRVVHPRVDHEQTRTYDVSKKTWWNPFVGDRNKFTDEAMRKAQRLVEEAASGDDVMNQARDQAESTLTDMYGFVGWDIDVVWEGDSKPSSAAN